MTTDRVIFRVWTGSEDNGVIALFPDMPEDDGLINSYMHIGQHGAASLSIVLAATREATAAESHDLRLELRQIGYAV